MPIYDRECLACQAKHEVLVPMWEQDKESPCPTCGAATKRIFSAANFQFKGPGFYATEYKKKGGPIEED